MPASADKDHSLFRREYPFDRGAKWSNQANRHLRYTDLGRGRMSPFVAANVQTRSGFRATSPPMRQPMGMTTDHTMALQRYPGKRCVSLPAQGDNSGPTSSRRGSGGTPLPAEDPHAQTRCEALG